MLMRRFILLSFCVVLAASHLFSPLPLAMADGSSSGAAATVKPQCSASTLDGEVIAPLVETLGENLVKKVLAFITSTPFGKILVGTEATTCIANTNGTILGNAIKSALDSDACKPFATITDIRFLNTAIMMLGNSSMQPTITDTLKFLKSIPTDEMDQFCSLYTDTIIPCVTSQLLPSLAVVRDKYSGGCCDGWVDDVLANYGYTISGQITKLAQLFGEVMCSSQAPGFSGEGTQRCGYTWIQTIVTKPDEATISAAVLKNLQVPTDQMCLRAEGKAYTDVNGKTVDESSTQPFPSGCVTPIDRLTTWLSGLPAARGTQPFDVQALFANDECLNGADLFPVIVDLIPELALDELKVYFSRSCVHLPTKFADKCTYSRPVTLVKWASEPLPAKETASPSTSEETPPSSSPEPSLSSAALPLRLSTRATFTLWAVLLLSTL